MEIIDPRGRTHRFMSTNSTETTHLAVGFVSARASDEAFRPRRSSGLAGSPQGPVGFVSARGRGGVPSRNADCQRAVAAVLGASAPARTPSRGVTPIIV